VTRYDLGQVLLARHARTVWNEEGRRQGQLDSPLLAGGASTTALLSRALSEQVVDGIFTSPLGRAAATAGIFGRDLGLPVIEIPELTEVHHGELAGLTRAQIDRAFPGVLDRRSKDKYNWRFPGGESYADADSRAHAALTRIAAHPARSPLIVSHEMIGRMLLRNLLDLPAQTALAITQPNDVLFRVDVLGRDFVRIQP
jgi:broad specificity phosphatase PhoE